MARDRKAPGRLNEFPYIVHRNADRPVDSGDRCSLRVNRRTQRNFRPGSLRFLIGYTGSRYSGHAAGIGVKIGGGYDPGRPKETIGVQKEVEER